MQPNKISADTFVKTQNLRFLESSPFHPGYIHSTLSLHTLPRTWLPSEHTPNLPRGISLTWNKLLVPGTFYMITALWSSLKTKDSFSLRKNTYYSIKLWTYALKNKVNPSPTPTTTKFSSPKTAFFSCLLHLALPSRKAQPIGVIKYLTEDINQSSIDSAPSSDHTVSRKLSEK